MSGPIWKTERGTLRAEDLEACVAALRAGGIVAVPTETVYGLAVDAMNPAALHRLQALKGRDSDKPLPVQVADRDSLEAIVEDVNRAAHRLLLRFTPGPITLIMKARPGLPAPVLGEGHSVGVRIPNHNVMLSILQAFGGPLAVTSAN
ncbi:MAG: L-threonylcarbamoyladenylate synthase, partial [Armatimonadota bacterium]|nr:L-threonylcarbamoyladenylate synthase [Armatimonadota bacterium]